MESTTIERPNTTLFGIHSQLLELYQLREDTAADPEARPGQQAEELAAIDKAIDDYIALEARKVDSVVIVMRQFDAAAKFNNDEAKRYRERAKMFDSKAQDIEDRLIRFMQANHLGEMQGKTARLKLAKNPASVNPRQPDLIPERFLRQDLTLSVEQWRAVETALLSWADQAKNAGVDDTVFIGLARAIHDARMKSAPAPDLVPIKKEMQLPCQKCGGGGRLPLSDHHPDKPGQSVPCGECGGSGKRAVAGCELVTDKVRLAVS